MKKTLLVLVGMTLCSSALAMNSLEDSIEAARLLPAEADLAVEIFLPHDVISGMEILRSGDQEILRVKASRGCTVDFVRDLTWPRGTNLDPATRKSVGYRVVQEMGCNKG